VTDVVGKRELNKRATREALDAAAKRLFAERGYVHTTVRDIADAAGVTERTFFRYFAGKEELILDEVLDWIPVLHQAIVARPVDEPPLVAVLRAAGALLRAQPAAAGPSPLLLFAHGRPVNGVGAGGAAFLLRIEDGLAAALRIRLAGTADADLQAELHARVALAIFRSVMIESTRDGTNPDERRDALADRLDGALDLVRAAL
jgi:AcrR family transcriptional regulator